MPRAVRNRRRGLLKVAVAGAAILALSYLPLVANELTANFSETKAVLDYLFGGGREGSDVNPLARLVIAGLRIVTWPLVGLVVDAGAVAILAALAVVALAVWLARGPAGDVRTAARWLGLGLLWSTIALGIAAPSLASVVRGLPNDHYHAFADPMVFTLVGLGVARLWAWRGRLPSRRPDGGPALPAWSGPALAVVLLGGLVAWNLTHLPPAVARDGGFPGAEAAAARIGETIGDRPTALRSIPDFKSTEAYAYPLVRDGRHLVSVPAQGDDDEAGRAARDAAEADATRAGRHLRRPVRDRDRRAVRRSGGGCRDPARRPLRLRGRSVGGVTGPLDLGLPRRDAEGGRCETGAGRWRRSRRCVRSTARPRTRISMRTPVPQHRRSLSPKDPVVEGDRAVPWCVL